MVEKIDAPESERDRRIDADHAARQAGAREALRRLRQIGESLPAVDAVVREGRDSAGRGER